MLKAPQFLYLNIFGSVSLLILSFIKSIIIIRIAGAHLFGYYQYIYALLMPPLLFSPSFDWLILRFYNSENADRQYVLWGNIYSKFAYLFLSVGYFVLISFNQERFYQAEHLSLLVFLITIQLNTANFKSLPLNLLSISKQYKQQNILEISTTLIWLLSVIIIKLAFNISPLNFLHFLVLFAILSDLFFITYYNTYLARENIIQWSRPLGIKNSFSKGVYQYKSYFLPFIGNDLAGYLKNYLPVYLMGRIGAFEAYSVFHIAKKLFTVIHKIIPKVLRGMLPSIVEKSSEPLFEKKWRLYSFKYVLLMFLVGNMLMILSPGIYELVYKIQLQQSDLMILMNFSLYLTLGALAQTCMMRVYLQSETKISLIHSFITNLFWIVFFTTFHNQLNTSFIAAGYWMNIFLVIMVMVVYFYYQNKELFKTLLMVLALLIPLSALTYGISLIMNQNFQWYVQILSWIKQSWAGSP